MEEGQKYARQCTECESGMDSGYCVGGGGEYYCSDECLHKHYTKEEWEEMCEDQVSDSYYTEWEDEDDFQFIVENGELKEIE